MFYIYARTKDGYDKHYWNRRKNEWQSDLTSACLYPTGKGANHVYQGIMKGGLIWRTFNELGWSKAQ